jgi:hypothetical protein
MTANNALERTVDYRGPQRGCQPLLAGSACGKRERVRLLTEPLAVILRQRL